MKEIEELGVVDRDFSGQMFVRMSDFVRDHLRGFLEAMKPTGDVKRAIRRRKHEREAERADDSQPAETAQTVATDGGTDRRPIAPSDVETSSTTGDGDHATHEPIPSNPPPD